MCVGFRDLNMGIFGGKHYFACRISFRYLLKCYFTKKTLTHLNKIGRASAPTQHLTFSLYLTVLCNTLHLLFYAISIRPSTLYCLLMDAHGYNSGMHMLGA